MPIRVSPRLRSLNGQNIRKGLWSVYKSGYQWVRRGDRDSQSIMFIFGCQRSGTTLMTQMVRWDLNACVYGEYSALSSRENGRRGLRLKPLPEVAEEIHRNKASFVLAKPLAETQNAREILDAFPRSKALWMYRHYQDVAVSKLKKSGLRNGIRDLEFMLKRSDNWRAENISEDTLDVVRSHYASDMNPYDAAAIYWYVRNSFLFQQNLDHDERIMMCRYEDLVTNPETMMREVYRFVELPFPGPHIVASVYASSIGRGGSIELSDSVVKLCDNMLARLDRLNRWENSARTEEINDLP